MRVSRGGLPGLTLPMANRKTEQQNGLTLTELLCVMAILLILFALYLPAIARAYRHVRSFLEGF
jgi:prepilin-type N-terminal cleavage/methylation domain-containing protein